MIITAAVLLLVDRGVHAFLEEEHLVNGLMSPANLAPSYGMVGIAIFIKFMSNIRDKIKVEIAELLLRDELAFEGHQPDAQGE